MELPKEFFMFFNRRLSSKALLGFRYRHTVGLVGLCNRIFHTTVYRLLLFYIGNASCIFNCPGGSGIPRYISLRVSKRTKMPKKIVMIVLFPCSLGVNFCFSQHFPGGIQAVICTVYTVKAFLFGK